MKLSTKLLIGLVVILLGVLLTQAIVSNQKIKAGYEQKILPGTKPNIQ